MLAKKWNGLATVVSSNSGHIQAKIDGQRCIIAAETGMLWTRNCMPHTSHPQLSAAIRRTTAAATASSPSLMAGWLWLDAKLCADRQDGGWRLHIFDVMHEHRPFNGRYARLRSWDEHATSTDREVLLLVPTEHVDASTLQRNGMMDQLRDKFRSQGYEGIIFRPDGDTEYQWGRRSQWLTKHKACEDREYEIVNLLPPKDDSTAETMARIQLRDPSTARKFTVRRFRGFDEDRKRQLYRELSLYEETGTYLATVEFPEYMLPSGIPRDAVCSGIRLACEVESTTEQIIAELAEAMGELEPSVKDDKGLVHETANRVMSSEDEKVQSMLASFERTWGREALSEVLETTLKYWCKRSGGELLRFYLRDGDVRDLTTRQLAKHPTAGRALCQPKPGRLRPT